jgi:hypothetical protein
MQLPQTGHALNATPDEIGTIRALKRLSIGSSHASALDSDAKPLFCPVMGECKNCKPCMWGMASQFPHGCGIWILQRRFRSAMTQSKRRPPEWAR